MQKLIAIFQKSWPDTLWGIAYGVLALLVLAAAMIPELLLRYGFSDSQAGLSTSISQAMGHLLDYLNGLQTTNFIVTFLFWGATGLLAFLIIQILLRALTSFYDEEVFASHYVHPRNFTISHYWLYVALSWLELVAICLFGLFILLNTFLLFVPELISTTKLFVQTYDISLGWKAAVWLLATWLGLCALHFAFGLLTQRRRFIEE